MTTKLQSNQMVNEAILKALGQNSRAELKDILAAVERDLDFPLRPYATHPTANAVLNFGSSAVTTGDGAKKALAPVKKQVFTLSANPFINFQDQTTSGDFDITWPVNVIGKFRRAGFTLIGSGKIKVLFSVEAATQAALVNAGSLFVNGGLPIGYIDLVATSTSLFKSATASTNIIQNADIFRFGTGAGGGSGTGDVTSFVDRIEHRLYDSYFQFVTPVVFTSDEQNFTNGSTTATFNNADGCYDFTAGQTFISTQLLNAEFLTFDYSPRQVEVHIEFFDTASMDLNAVISASIDGAAYTTVTMARQGLSNVMIGRVVLPSSATKDLRFKMVASATCKLTAFGMFYDEQVGSVVEGSFQQERVSFSGDANQNSFTLGNFLPDSRMMKVYDITTGQVYRYPAFTVSGFTVTFPANTFLVPGETLELLFDQSEGAGYDYSDFNNALLSANALGSMDSTIDRSVAGRGIIMRNEAGKRVELYLDANNNLIPRPLE